MTQKEVFLDSEADQFHQRNAATSGSLQERMSRDPVLVTLDSASVEFDSILEVGCGNGWRLEALRRSRGAAAHGVEPSSAAVADGQAMFPELDLRVGTADVLPFEDGAFDLVLFGFCLYLCDRKDLFRIAGEADRVLREGGHVAIFDFHPPFAYRNPYRHREGIFTYKMDYSRMFLWNPAYYLTAHSMFRHSETADSEDPDERLSVSVIRKGGNSAYIESPFAKG